MPPPDLSPLSGAPGTGTPSPAEIAATLHGRFWADPATDCQALTSVPTDRAEAAMLDDPAEIQASLDADGCGTLCPVCEGDCVVPACTDPACDCHLESPCRTAQCPCCGGIGTV